MTFVRMQDGLAAVDRALRRPLPIRPSRRASGFAGGLALFIGVVLLLDALLTIVWQDPITAVFAQRDQKALGKELSAVERAPLPSGTLALVEDAGSDRERMAVLADNLRRHSPPRKPLGRIAIPKIGASFVFVSGTGEKSLKEGPGHYASSALPGQRGTMALAGHRTTYSAPFRRLDKLRRGHRITLTMPYGRFTYSVEGSRVVKPNNIGVIRHVKHNRLVLTTCTPLFSAARRLIITARIESSTPRGQALSFKPLPPVAPLLTKHD
jgi:sortase A